MLAADENLRVLLLEAGPGDTDGLVPELGTRTAVCVAADFDWNF